MIITPKAVFVHIPKTGGGAISGALKKVGGISCWGTHSKMLRRRKPEIQNRFVFTVVRNPFTAVASCYRWRYQVPFRKRAYKKLTFYEFISHIYEVGYLNQLSYISEDGEILVDYVARFEQLDNEWEYIASKVNAPKKLSKNRKTHYIGTYNWKSYYTPRSIRRVEEVFKDDLEYFGYKYE